MTFKLALYTAAAIALFGAGGSRPADDFKRPGVGMARPELSGKPENSGTEMAGPISPEYNGRSDFGRIIEWDPKGPHYWLAEIQNGNIKVLDDYSDAEKCWKATFAAGPKDGPWRVCIPLDEPAEEFLARVIYLHVN